MATRAPYKNNNFASNNIIKINSNLTLSAHFAI